MNYKKPLTIPKGFHAEIDDDKVVIKKGEKPTTWSEEDEKMLKIIDKILFKASITLVLGTIRCPYDDARDWLKDLKQRITNK